jgi:ABC-type oligopeptide transport system substrate-binding subunit
MARNPSYHGLRRGNLERVVLHLIDDAWISLEMYERDELDVLFPEVLDRALMTKARMRHPTEDLSLPRANTKLLGFDVRRPPFDDVRVRRAFALALDKSAVSGPVACGFFPATGGFVPPGIPGHQADSALPFDPARARRLLAEAGYPGGRGLPPVDLLYVSGLESFCVELQEQWQANLNVQVDWSTLPWPEFLARLRAGKKWPHIYAHGWGGISSDPDFVLRAGVFRQWCGWTHERYDEIVEVARRNTDAELRLALYAEAEGILREEVPIVPLLYGLNMALVKPWVTRFPTSALRWPAWQDVVLEPH